LGTITSAPPQPDFAAAAAEEPEEAIERQAANLDYSYWTEIRHGELKEMESFVRIHYFRLH
jgi:hypothetical protein